MEKFLKLLCAVQADVFCSFLLRFKKCCLPFTKLIAELENYIDPNTNMTVLFLSKTLWWLLTVFMVTLKPPDSSIPEPLWPDPGLALLTYCLPALLTGPHISLSKWVKLLLALCILPFYLLSSLWRISCHYLLLHSFTDYSLLILKTQGSTSNQEASLPTPPLASRLG